MLMTKALLIYLTPYFLIAAISFCLWAFVGTVLAAIDELEGGR